jgi:hypothetical protein
MRATVSEPPPGGYGTIIRIGFAGTHAGVPCATAAGASTVAATPSTHAAVKRRRLAFHPLLDEFTMACLL